MTKEMIEKITKASGVSSGELILIHFWGEDSDKEIANNFLAAVAALGATPVLLQQSRSINRELFLAATEECFPKKFFDLFSKFDAVLDVFAYQPVVLGYEIKDEKMNLYRKYIAQLFHKLVECKRFTQIKIPTIANAIDSPLQPQDYIQRMNQAYDIDYEALEKDCEHEVKRFSGVNQVAVYTGDDCVLHFDLTGRNWFIDAGDGDLPCGEIYIAPIENHTQGSVFFNKLYWDGEIYSNVILQISNGKVNDSSHPEIAKYISEQPPENLTVCELGIGMNPHVTKLCGYTALDEKMIGTFHIALGANHLFGGTNVASQHVDFVGYGRIEVEK